MIYFVGMHNKPGREPLDTRTYTGQIIDQIIEQTEEECTKTNLADIPEIPKNPTWHAEEWYKKHQPNQGDTIVLLGKWVRKHFIKKDGITYIETNHPSAIIVRKNKVGFIEKTTQILKHG